ncbi:MAG: hypothetical protein CFE34_03605 [Rhodobacteraceae bacterium PARR1]|nr:MAG: hypothetical protein CFE34_03605 [Rhodobacteraceae bacterium PARR1]
MIPPADAPLVRLARLGDRLEFAAAAGVDAPELDPLVAEIDRLARSFDADTLTQDQRAQLAEVSAQVDRILTLLSERQAQDVAQDIAAQSRDERLRRAYGAGR